MPGGPAPAGPLPSGHPGLARGATRDFADVEAEVEANVFQAGAFGAAASLRRMAAGNGSLVAVGGGQKRARLQGYDDVAPLSEVDLRSSPPAHSHAYAQAQAHAQAQAQAQAQARANAQAHAGSSAQGQRGVSRPPVPPEALSMFPGLAPGERPGVCGCGSGFSMRRPMVRCDNCGRWEHLACAGIARIRGHTQLLPNHHICRGCIAAAEKVAALRDADEALVTGQRRRRPYTGTGPALLAAAGMPPGAGVGPGAYAAIPADPTGVGAGMDAGMGAGAGAADAAHVTRAEHGPASLAGLTFVGPVHPAPLAYYPSASSVSGSSSAAANAIPAPGNNAFEPWDRPLAERVSFFMQRRGISQTALVALTGFSGGQAAMSSWLNGKAVGRLGDKQARMRLWVEEQERALAANSGGDADVFAGFDAATPAPGV